MTLSRTTKRSEINEFLYKPQILHLNLPKKWFDMIQKGEKKEEYREIKPYWIKRLIFDPFELFKIDEQMQNFMHASKTKSLKDILQFYSCYLKDFDTIGFSNGYHKGREQFAVELKSIEIGEGKTEWGDEKGKRYFVLKLGNIVDVVRIEESIGL